MDYQEGDVIRLGNWPFADCTIVRVRDDVCTLVRPYVYASECGTALTGHETMAFTMAQVDHYERIDTGRVS